MFNSEYIPSIHKLCIENRDEIKALRTKIQALETMVIKNSGSYYDIKCNEFKERLIDALPLKSDREKLRGLVEFVKEMIAENDEMRKTLETISKQID